MSADSVTGRRPDLRQAVFDALDHGAAVFDPASGSVLDINPAMLRMFGYSPDEASGLTAKRFCPEPEPFSLSNALALARRAIAQGPQRFEWRTRDRHGRALRVEVQLKGIEYGGRASLLAIVHDIESREISAREAADLSALRRQAAIGALTGGIAHSLNNSLTPILGYAAEARCMASTPALAYCLDETLKACGKAKDLIASLLALSRRNNTGREAMYLWPAIESSRHALRALLPAGVSLDVQGDASDVMAVVAPGDVHELVLSLCTAASRSFPEGRGSLVLRLGTASTASACRLAVHAAAATGGPVGLSAAGEGVLASARELAQSLGGNLELSFRTDGLELSVLLPGVAARTRVESKPDDRGHVLFIDDDEAIARLVCKQLTSAGFTVTAVSDPDEGLRRFSHAPMDFGCVVTDLLMPRLSGQTLAQRIRELRPDVPVLLCSGNCDLGSLDAASTHCFSGFIPKPFSKRELTRAVSAALAKPTTEPAG